MTSLPWRNLEEYEDVGGGRINLYIDNTQPASLIYYY
jgi:hypothetical protein